MMSVIGLPPWPTGLTAEIMHRSVPSTEDGYVEHSRHLFNPPLSMPYLSQCAAYVRDLTGDRVRPVNAFGRVWSNGAILRTHTDRETLDWTISIMLACDAQWDIEAEINGHWQAVTMDSGMAIILPGREVRHRRKRPFEGAYAVTLYLHYEKLDG